MKPKRKKILLYVVLPLFVVMAAGGFYFYKEYNRVHKDTAKLKPDYILKAADLVREFEANEQASYKKYQDKVILINGVIKQLEKDDKGFYSVVLGDTSSMSSVRCSIDSLHNKEAAEVQQGSTIAVKGICTGFNADELLGSDVILTRSVVNK
ncbi:MAG: hypothetical protein IPH18_05660 [Chitinophagaceae bacterium]|nr:hypothetical protein [Chitinophagaceae bacterium]MBK8951313.1 hypothetical protein [Chitinophagaceae bacterium]